MARCWADEAVTTMKAFAIDSHKAALRPRELPDPVAGPGEVVVAIAAASVNPLDVKLREGAFKLILPYSMPLVLGHDLAGTVIEVGPATRRFKVGDEVFGRAGTKHIGSFAERIAVAEADLAFKPATLSMAEAAALPLVSLTAWQVLVYRARLRPGQRVLVHAGSGGVGTVAIQLARHLDAQVATTVGPDNLVPERQLRVSVWRIGQTFDFQKCSAGRPHRMARGFENHMLFLHNTGDRRAGFRFGGMHVSMQKLDHLDGSLRTSVELKSKRP